MPRTNAIQGEVVSYLPEDVLNGWGYGKAVQKEFMARLGASAADTRARVQGRTPHSHVHAQLASQ